MTRVPTTVVPVLVLGMVGSLAGCAAGEPVQVATAGTTGTTGTGAPMAGTAAIAPAPSGSPTGTMAQVPDPSATAPASGPATPAPSGALKAAVVQQIRAADQGGFDRVVVEFQGTFGAWRVEYVDAITEDPSDEPVQLTGSAFLRVNVQNATFDNVFQAGAGVPHVAYAGPDRIDAGLPNVQQVADAGDFEAVLTLGIGLDSRAGVRAYRLENPSRLVIDIAH